MQTFLLPDVLQDLCSPAFATKHGRYLRKMDKRGIGTLSFVRASSEPVMFPPVLKASSSEKLPNPLLYSFVATGGAQQTDLAQ